MSAIVLTVVALCFITLDLGGGACATPTTACAAASGSLYRGTDAVLGPVRRWVEGVPVGRHQHRADRRAAQENAKLRGAARRAADRPPHSRPAGPVAARRRRQRQPGSCPARVIAFGPGAGFDWTVTLDVGTRSGVRVGQTVTDGAGLVGRVLHADADSSVVLLAADPGSGVGVRDTAPASWAWPPAAAPTGSRSRRSSPNAEVQVGDLLADRPDRRVAATSPGLPVGTVHGGPHRADGTVHGSVEPGRLADRGRPRRRDRATGLDASRARAARTGGPAMTRARVAAALAAIITALLLQATLVAPVTAPWPVSLPAVLVAAVALVDGPATGMSLGFAAGLVADLGSHHPAGVLALCWLGVGLLLRHARRPAQRCAATRSSPASVCGAGRRRRDAAARARAQPRRVGCATPCATPLPAAARRRVLALGASCRSCARMLRTDSLRAPRPVYTELAVSPRDDDLADRAAPWLSAAAHRPRRGSGSSSRSSRR